MNTDEPTDGKPSREDVMEVFAGPCGWHFASVTYGGTTIEDWFEGNPVWDHRVCPFANRNDAQLVIEAVAARGKQFDFACLLMNPDITPHGSASFGAFDLVEAMLKPCPDICFAAFEVLK